MNQVKIGKLIQQLRKELQLTQKELGEQLGVSDKTISKWETGSGMPDLVFLKPLSDILGITVNELLCGERMTDDDFKIKAEETIVNTIQYSKEKMKRSLCNTYLLVFGIFLFTISLLFLPSNGMKVWFSLLALLIISIGIFRSCLRYPIVLSSLFFIASIFLLLAMDYYHVQNNQEPFFALSVGTKNQIITYQTPFYSAYRCNPNTTNEYYEVDFTRQKAKCMNPFDPNKSSIGRLVQFQSQYLGNNSNTVHLYQVLPLSQYGFTTELDSTQFGIKLYYNNSEFYIKEDNQDELFVQRSLIYNAISTFLLIDNVRYIEYHFSGSSYQIQKEAVLSNYPHFEQLSQQRKINQNQFQKYVTLKIKDNTFIHQQFEKLFQEI